MTVEIVVKETKGVPAIPRSFLVEKKDGQYVWTDQEGKAILLKAINPLIIGNYAIIDNLPEETILIEPGNFREGKKIQVEMLTSD